MPLLSIPSMKSIQWSLRLLFHASLSGAFVIAWLTGDEDTYHMHVFAGYLVLILAVLRGGVGLLAGSRSSLGLPQPQGAALVTWFRALAVGNAAGLRGRSPLVAWLAAATLLGVGLAAASGVAADWIPSVEELHEGLSEIALWLVGVHVAGMVALNRLKRLLASSASLAPGVCTERSLRKQPTIKVLARSPLSLPLCSSKALPALILFVALGGAAGARAEAARDRMLADYAAAARAESPDFTGFSAARGRALYLGPHPGGKPETNACAVCHTADPAGSGQHARTGRTIAPMAVRVNPERFTSSADVEKRFQRDCQAVLGRACTARDKGDFITFLVMY